MKPYLINVYTKTEHLDRFFESVKKINIEEINIQPPQYPGNLNRFKLIPEFTDKKRWIIFTDTEDVIFQSDFPDFDNIGFDIVVAPENEIHKNSYWKSFCEKYPIFEDLKERQIYNAGCFAMRVNKFFKFIKFLNTFNKVELPQNMDQLLFNKWLSTQDFIADLTIFAPLYKNYELGLIKKEEGIWKTKNGKIINCVHANGNLKDLL